MTTFKLSDIAIQALLGLNLVENALIAQIGALYGCFRLSAAEPLSLETT